MLHTDRLILRRWRADDLKPYSAICADPEVMRWIGNGSVRTQEQCAKALERFDRATIDPNCDRPVHVYRVRRSAGATGL